MDNTMDTPGGGNARDQVSTPAILLMVIGGLGIAGALIGVVQSLSGANTAAMDQILSNPDLPQGARSVFAGMTKGGIFLNLFQLIIGGLICFGGLKMKNLESYGLAMAASIIACIPCLTCCCLGIPVGIWSLVVLNKPEVKSAFPQQT